MAWERPRVQIPSAPPYTHRRCTYQKNVPPRLGGGLIMPDSFTITDAEKAFCARIGVPLPTLAPLERLRELMATRNEWKLYHRTCDKTGKPLISAYPPDSPFTVYENAIWWGDTWDGCDYGREYDFQKPFFEQFAALQKVVPREGTSIFNSENCDYNSHIRESRNCYLNSLIVGCEDTLYSYWVVNNKNVIDSMYTNDSTLCYECSDVNNCYNCVMLQEANNCSDCLFSYQLRGCKNCIFSTNLINKEYCIFNQPCTKEEFEKTRAEILDGSWKTWQEACKKYADIKQKTIHRAVQMLQCENCTGDHIYKSKNCTNSFEGHSSEDCENALSFANSKDLFTIYSAGWQGCEMIYYSTVMRSCTNLKFCKYSWFSTNLSYCDACVSSENCFGCIGLRRKKYCILNKQYTKEEYESLMPRIIAQMEKTGEWGTFFPPALSPFAYNETGAQDFFPLTKEEALKNGWRWRDPDQKEYQPATIPSLPDTIAAIPETITKEVLACTQCAKNYRIIPQELKVYRERGFPLPRFCPECRHKKRFQMRNGYKFWNRACAHCQKTMQTTYAPQRPEKVVCDECYLKEVY